MSTQCSVLTFGVYFKHYHYSIHTLKIGHLMVVGEECKTLNHLIGSVAEMTIKED